MKKALLYTGGAAVLLTGAAAIYGTVVYQQAKSTPAMLAPSEEKASLHRTLVGLVSVWQQKEQFLGPLATGRGYHEEVFERVSKDTQSQFKGLVALKTCAPASDEVEREAKDKAPKEPSLTKMVSIAKMSGISKELYMHGAIGLKTKEQSAAERFKDDPVVMATYFQMGDEPGLTHLVGSTPSWTWLKPKLLDDKPALSSALTASLGDCKPAAKLAEFAEAMMTKNEVKVLLENGAEVLLQRVQAEGAQANTGVAEFAYTGTRATVEQVAAALYRGVSRQAGGDSTIAQLNRHETIEGRPEAFSHLFIEDLMKPGSAKAGVISHLEGEVGRVSLSARTAKSGS